MRLLLVGLILAAVPAARGDEVARAPLSEKEIGEGWIALFDGKTTFGWTSPNESQWTIAEGMLAPQKSKPGLLVTTTAFSDYRLVVEFRQAQNSTFSLRHCCDAAGKPLQGAAPDLKRVTGGGWWSYNIEVSQGRVMSEYLASTNIRFNTTLAPDAGLSPTAGNLALSGNGFVIRAVKLLPRRTNPLLNGKNLDGWNAHPGRKSKFSVTKEGWLSLQDGSGDLQTTKQWDDFVLQLECKTNGKNLNSGVFFRCLPNEYQMGYEAQIHNGFGVTKDIILDAIDPQTGKLLGKKVEKTNAIDFGTGAIYRRKPARHQAARDQEWFTMTVVARGRHMATWVNGLQLVDWTDPRPLAENARKGAYLKKGPISLQGHDPTTDLLFRNLRIAELASR